MAVDDTGADPVFEHIGNEQWINDIGCHGPFDAGDPFSGSGDPFNGFEDKEVSPEPAGNPGSDGVRGDLP